MVFLNAKRELFYLYKKCMKILGIWPLDCHKHESAIIFWVLISVKVQVLIIRLIDPLGKCPAYGLENYELQITIWRISSITIALSFRLLERRIKSLIESTIDDWSSTTNPEEREIMIQHEKRGSWIIVFSIVVILFPCVWQFMGLPFIKLTNTTDKRDSCAFADDSTWFTVNAILGQIVSVSNNVMCLSIRSFYWTIAMHLSAQYKILRARFHDLQIITEKKESRRVFRRLLLRHNELFVLSRDYENSSNIVIAIFAFAEQIAITMNATMLIANVKSLNFVGMIMDLTTIALFLLDLFLFYYASDYMTACSEEVGDEFKQCNWYDLSKDDRINYSIVISRCRMPMEFTAMKIYKFNLSNFKYMLQALHSYVSVMVARVDVK